MDDLELKAAVDQFCCFIEALPKPAVAESKWGPKEILAHLVFWHESYVEQIKALLAGEAYGHLQGRFNDLNAQAVATNRRVSIPRLVCRLRAADEKLRTLYSSHDPATIVLEIKQGSKPWRLSDLVPAVAAHVRNHQRQLERATKNALPGRRTGSDPSRRSKKKIRKEEQ